MIDCPACAFEAGYDAAAEQTAALRDEITRLRQDVLAEAAKVPHGECREQTAALSVTAQERAEQAADSFVGGGPRPIVVASLTALLDAFAAERTAALRTALRRALPTVDQVAELLHDECMDSKSDWYDKRSWAEIEEIHRESHRDGARRALAAVERSRR